MQIEVMTDDHSCPNCYYEGFDERAYPCSRCIHNKPSEDMFRPKIRAEQTIELDAEAEQIARRIATILESEQDMRVILQNNERRKGDSDADITKID